MIVKAVSRNSLRGPQGNNKSSKEGCPLHLTKRETEILNWLSHGKNSIEISMILGICESTVKFHVNNTLVKLNASNRTHAVATALRMELI